MTAAITLLYSPFPSTEQARTAARHLLERRLVACCTILPAAESHYRWDGALTQSAEAILLCKTSSEQEAAARAALETLHPYECPAILSFSAAANLPFAQWIAAETSVSSPGEFP